MKRFAAALFLAACSPAIDMDGDKSTNNAFRVTVSRAAPFPAAVLAQELYEADRKQDPVQAVLIRADSSIRRDMELTGHEIETQAAALIYGQDAGAYRLREAEAMRRGYDGLFESMTVAQIVAAMEARSATALRWVVRNREMLERYR